MRKVGKILLVIVCVIGIAVAGINLAMRNERPQTIIHLCFGDRRWLKGVARGRNKRFQPATEQAASASSRT